MLGMSSAKLECALPVSILLDESSSGELQLKIPESGAEAVTAYVLIVWRTRSGGDGSGAQKSRLNGNDIIVQCTLHPCQCEAEE